MYVRNISLICPQKKKKKDTCMSKLGSQSFHVPQTPRGSDSEDKDTGLLGPPLLPVLCGYPQSVGKKHPHAHFPKCNSNSAWLPPSLSAATRKDLGAALLELQEGIAGERPVVGLRKSWLSGLRYRITEQLPGFMRIMPGSQHPRGFHGNYFRRIINILQEQRRCCMAPWYLPAASNPFGK